MTYCAYLVVGIILGVVGTLYFSRNESTNITKTNENSKNNYSHENSINPTDTSQWI